MKETFKDRLRSARFIVFILITVTAGLLVLWIVGKASSETIDKVAVIAVTGFFNVWTSIATFYFTRKDRKEEPPSA